MNSIETERLIIHKMNKKFISEEYLSWLNDIDVKKYLELPEKTTFQELTNYVEFAIKENFCFWAITLKRDNKHIGNIKIDPINNKHKYGEYGILIGNKQEWGKGYAKEASIAIVDYCFEELDLRKVNLGVVEDNYPAVKMYESIGFQVEGKLIKHGFYDGYYRNLLRMSIFNPKFK